MPSPPLICWVGEGIWEPMNRECCWTIRRYGDTCYALGSVAMQRRAEATDAGADQQELIMTRGGE